MATRKFGARPGLGKADVGIRKVARTFGKAAFLTHGDKATGMFTVESASERLISHLLSIDPNVRSYRPQPFTIDLRGRALLRTAEEKQAARDKYRGTPDGSSFYTPDFHVGWCSGTETAVEVKTEDYRGDCAYEQKLLQAKDVLWAHGLQFMQVVAPGYWRHPLLTNVPLLYQASARRDLHPTADIVAQVATLAEAGVCTLGGFCTALGMEVRMGPVLIAFGVLRTDLMAHDLNNATPASPAFGDLEHLSILVKLCK